MARHMHLASVLADDFRGNVREGWSKDNYDCHFEVFIGFENRDLT